MAPVKQHDNIPVDVYLTGELTSPEKHEYVDGRLYAMAGATTAHNRIAGNVFADMHAQLRGKRCEAFNSDMKVRIRLPTHVRFYYPDASVVCRPNSPDESYQDAPVVIVEVLSPDTRRVDEDEKKEHYLTIDSLAVYLLFEQNAAAVRVFRRTDRGFVQEVYEGREVVIPLPEIDVTLKLADAYARVTFEGAEHEPTDRAS